MRRVVLQPGADLAGFRHAVRLLIAAGTPPQDVAWSIDAAPSLFGQDVSGAAPPVALPGMAADWIELVVCHRDPERYALLYALVWRLLHGGPALLAVGSDRLVHRIALLAKTIRRDLHKMHAFLRFRRIEDAGGTERFVAWFEPGHYIVEATADFFVDRFRGMTWSIFTPVGSLHWDRTRLVVGPPGTRADAADADGFEAGWRGYYESIFNPARVNPTAMRAEMAKKYWHNMPEAAAIPDLIRTAPARVAEMIAREAAAPRKRNPDKAVSAMLEQRTAEPRA
jgi:DNA polymerase